ncbi:magnesium/cobalt efflux protein, partial [Paracoccaceae bacterium]|nr:magnesium/cobalt efflux protein [Paracoccaceae bacterium]
MDDSDGSARAAQSAQPIRQDKGFWNWFRFDRGDRESARHEQVGASQMQSLIRQPDHIGMMNLRRKRVEDVAIPKAEIVSVSDTISRDDLAAV